MRYLIRFVTPWLVHLPSGPNRFMPETDRIKIEVAYATTDRQILLPVEVAVGTTAVQALEESGISSQFPRIDWKNRVIGIFGKVCNPDQVLIAGDRVEIYRALLMDPKQQRRQRADKSGA